MEDTPYRISYFLNSTRPYAVWDSRIAESIRDPLWLQAHLKDFETIHQANAYVRRLMKKSS